MKWFLYVIMIILMFANSYGISQENVTHHSLFDTHFDIIIPLSHFEIKNQADNISYDELRFKVSYPLTALNIKISNNSMISDILRFNITRYNLSNILKNNSFLFDTYIAFFNTSVPVFIGPNAFDEYLLEKYGIGIVNGFVKYKNKIGKYPFNSAIVSFTLENKRHIVIYSNAIEGDIAALRYLKEHIDEFIYMDNSYYLNDIDALSVYDFMHTKENHKWYNKDSNNFKEIIAKALFGKVEENIIDIKTNEGVMLRIMEIEPLNSEKFINYSQNIRLPVILSRGLWSNLYSWEDFGIDLADKGRDVFLIEITGGPGQDCDDCVNYNYSDLVDSYWPALIGTIQTLNNNSQVQYVGHSNGARTGVSSLEVYNDAGKQNAGQYFDDNKGTWINVSMTKEPVDTYIAVGMPGAFDGNQSLFGRIIRDNYDEMISNLEEMNKSHITFWEAFQTYKNLPNPFGEEDSISLNLVKYYFFHIFDKKDIQNSVSFNVSNFIIITGTKFDNYQNDGIVTVYDNNYLFNSSKARNTEQYYLNLLHLSMGENGHVQFIISNRLNNKELTTFKKETYSYRER